MLTYGASDRNGSACSKVPMETIWACVEDDCTARINKGNLSLLAVASCRILPGPHLRNPARSWTSSRRVRTHLSGVWSGDAPSASHQHVEAAAPLCTALISLHNDGQRRLQPPQQRRPRFMLTTSAIMRTTSSMSLLLLVVTLLITTIIGNWGRSEDYQRCSNYPSCSFSSPSFSSSS